MKFVFSMKLSLIVPVCNDLEGSRNVVRQACELGIFTQVILSDDASDMPFSADEITGGIPGPYPDLVILRHEIRGGAGRARNSALAKVTGTHVLFFDADDILRPDLVDVWRRLEQETEDFDFCIFRHVEERCRQDGHLGMFPSDETLWAEAGAVHVFGELAPKLAPKLAQVAAYPWNKIYRTEFLRTGGVRCGETLVHNDIGLHWLGFLRAERILYATVLGCEHVLGTGRNHLTRRRGRERLQVFDALKDVLAETGPLSSTWNLAFSLFYLDLLVWARARVAAADLSDFDQLAQDFLQAQVSAGLFAQINRRNPDVARHGLDMLSGDTEGRE